MASKQISRSIRILISFITMIFRITPDSFYPKISFYYDWKTAFREVKNILKYPGNYKLGKS